jgi:hypothetical protein
VDGGGAAVCADAFHKNPASNEVSSTPVFDILVLRNESLHPWSGYIVSIKAWVEIVTGVTGTDTVYMAENRGEWSQ